MNVRTVSTPVHGGLDLGELEALGLRPEQVLDFSANLNPLGPSPRGRDVLVDIDITAYPDRECLALRRALSAHLDAPLDGILVGNGSTELFHLLARAFLGPGDAALLFEPTFGEYEAAASLTGAQVLRLRAREEDGFRWDVDQAVREIETTRPRLVFLCNPNNPTGVYMEQAHVERIAAAVGEDGLLALDEAYGSFVEGPWNSRNLLDRPNVVLLRSMTKEFGLAGLRLGYALGPPSVLDSMRRQQPSWSVNAAAQAAGVASLEDQEHLDRAMDEVRRGKEHLLAGLEGLGLSVLPSAANFLLIRVGDAPEVRRQLLLRGLCVRDCTSFGLPQHVRVAVRTVPDCQRLVTALGEVLRHG
jgi:histidinol-phosphate aminotransferase